MSTLEKRHNEKLLLVRNDVQPTNLSESSKHLNRNSNVDLIRFNLGNSQFSIVTFCYISPDNCTIIFLNIHRILNDADIVYDLGHVR